MKNPHGVEPTRFMKRKESEYAITCRGDCGPIFGHCIKSGLGWSVGRRVYGDLEIGNSCSIKNDGDNGYECHPRHKSSLFVDSSSCSVLDYEVYCIDFESKYSINHICKHPDFIWEYIKTNKISEESLIYFYDDTELLNDLDAIHCHDTSIRLKISNYYLKNPSEFLPDTQLVNQQYDAKLREWLGDDYKWKLIYRSSEHGYTVESFHKYCDDKGPTLIVIKSSGGWIFGGYTTQSWSGSIFFLFCFPCHFRV